MQVREYFSEMNLDYFSSLIRRPTSRIIRWLQRRALIASPLYCGTCNNNMTLITRNDDHVDGFLWLVPTEIRKINIQKYIRSLVWIRLLFLGDVKIVPKSEAFEQTVYSRNFRKYHFVT